jgi:hypothetical protein
VAEEVFNTEELKACKRSLLDYWCMVIRDHEAQVAMNDLIRKYCPDRSLTFMAAAPEKEEYVAPDDEEIPSIDEDSRENGMEDD